MTRRQQLKAQKCSRVKETTSAALAAAMTALWDENIYYTYAYEFIKLLSTVGVVYAGLGKYSYNKIFLKFEFKFIYSI